MLLSPRRRNSFETVSEYKCERCLVRNSLFYLFLLSIWLVMSSTGLQTEIRRREYIFTWFIENYSYCSHKNGEELCSPEFTADDMERTVWKIKLCPRGLLDEHEGFISIYLVRAKDRGPQYFPVNHELSMLGKNESIRKSDTEYCSFRKGSGYGYHRFIEIRKVLVSRKADYLPQNCLSVRCRIWNDEGKIRSLAGSSARTRIGIEQISFVHVVKDFSALEPNQENTMKIKYTSKNKIPLVSHLYFADGEIIIKITSDNAIRYLSKCKFSLLDESGKKIECSEIDYEFDAINMYSRNLPLPLTRQDILNRKSEYIPDDRLSLLCIYTFCNGVEYEKIEGNIYVKPCSAVNLITVIDEEEDNIYAKKLSEIDNALDEFKSIYTNEYLADIYLKTNTRTFHAHKIVLWARSSVFKAMLTSDMKEKKTNCIQVEDMDDDTVQQFLLFLYSDNLKNLQWKTAIKLYYAADKYDIEKLKILCSSFLVENIKPSNASELLDLADMHSDMHLKKAVEDIIFKHKSFVFRSKEWKDLIETDPRLASKIMFNRKA